MKLVSSPNNPSAFVAKGEAFQSHKDLFYELLTSIDAYFCSDNALDEIRDEGACIVDPGCVTNAEIIIGMQKAGYLNVSPDTEYVTSDPWGGKGVDYPIAKKQLEIPILKTNFYLFELDEKKLRDTYISFKHNS